MVTRKQVATFLDLLAGDYEMPGWMLLPMLILPRRARNKSEAAIKFDGFLDGAYHDVLRVFSRV